MLSKAWETYSEHPDRAIPATKNEVLAYQASFKDFAKRILAQNPNIQLHEITPKHAQEFADYLKTTEIAVDTHNRKIKHVRKVFNVLHIYCQSKPNPFLSKNLFRSNKEERNFAVRRLPFSHEQEKELLAVLDNPKKRVINKEELKIVFYLGMFTGQRLKDCVLLRWNRINFQRRIIEVKQYKTGKEVIIHMAEHLYQVLQEALKWKKEDHDFVCPKVAMRYNQVDENGKNTGSGLVNIDVMRIIRAAGIEPSVAVEGRKKAVTVYGFHSLRHSFVSRCALEGVPKAVVLSIVGADSEVVDKYYTHVGEKAQQQAIEAIAGNVGMLSAEDKINRTLTYIDNLKKSDELQEIIKLLTEN